jgi:glucokinase
MQQQALVAGIDIGGTNVALGLVNRQGEIIWKDSFSTKQFDDFNLLVSHAAEIIQTAVLQLNNAHLIGCGVGAPNGNYYSGSIEYAPNLVWKGIVPVAALFKKALQVNSIVTNDANAAALGEKLYGAAQPFNDFILITLGTGLGSGLVVQGQLVYGHDGFAGELGHVIVEPDGRACGCGRKGCLETYCSATGIVKTYQELSSDQSLLSAHKIYQLASEGNEVALQAFELTAKRLGLALANAVAYTSPEAIILFGGLVRAGDLLMKPTRNYFEANLHNLYRGKVNLLTSTLNESDAAILGAASLVWQHEK